MMFIEIEGPIEGLRDLVGIDGLRLQRGAHDLGGGRFRASAFVTSKSAVAEVQARGLTVRVTLDENEVNRRVQADLDRAKRTRRDTTPLDEGGNDGGDHDKAKDKDLDKEGGTPGSRTP